jgi:ferritin-like protein
MSDCSHPCKKQKKYSEVYCYEIVQRLSKQTSTPEEIKSLRKTCLKLLATHPDEVEQIDEEIQSLEENYTVAKRKLAELANLKNGHRAATHKLCKLVMKRVTKKKVGIESLIEVGAELLAIQNKLEAIHFKLMDLEFRDMIRRNTGLEPTVNLHDIRDLRD